MHDLQRVRFETDADIVRLVQGVIDDGAPRLLERDGTPVAVLLSPGDFAAITAAAVHDVWVGYDPGRARRALTEGAIVLAGVDGDELARDVRDARRQDSHGRTA